MVKVEIQKITDKELVMKLVGEDHTLGNLLAKKALEHPNVKMAAYVVEHPLEGSPVIRIVTDGSKNPLDVLKDVIIDSKNEAEELLEVLTKKLGM